MDLMEKDQYEEYVITQLRKKYVSAAWDFGTDYNVFLYTKKDESLYQLSISSDGFYAIDPYLQEALKRQINSLSQQTLSLIHIYLYHEQCLTCIQKGEAVQKVQTGGFGV